MVDGYVVRTAALEDAAALPAIERACASIFPPGRIPEHLAGDACSETDLREAALAGRLWVATNEAGRPVGFSLLETGVGVAFLAEVDVLPEHGRKGLGRELVRKAVDKARAEGYEAVYLTTFRNIEWNAPFYASDGFVEAAKYALPEPIARILAEEARLGFVDRMAMRKTLQQDVE